VAFILRFRDQYKFCSCNGPEYGFFVSVCVDILKNIVPNAPVNSGVVPRVSVCVFKITKLAVWRRLQHSYHIKMNKIGNFTSKFYSKHYFGLVSSESLFTWIRARALERVLTGLIFFVYAYVKFRSEPCDFKISQSRKICSPNNEVTDPSTEYCLLVCVLKRVYCSHIFGPFNTEKLILFANIVPRDFNYNCM